MAAAAAAGALSSAAQQQAAQAAISAYWADIRTRSWSDIPAAHKKVSETLVERAELEGAGRKCLFLLFPTGAAYFFELFLIIWGGVRIIAKVWDDQAQVMLSGERDQPPKGSWKTHRLSATYSQSDTLPSPPWKPAPWTRTTVTYVVEEAPVSS